MSTSQAPPEILSTGDVARLMGVTNQWVWELTKAGRLPVARRTPGGRNLYDRAAILRYVAEQAKRADAGGQS